MPPRSLLANVLALLLAAATVRANVADDLRQGAEATARRDHKAAFAAYRRAFETKAATAGQRRQALDGLLETTVEAGGAADLLAYVQRRRTEAPADQQPLLRDAKARCRKALDGHLHGAIEALTRRAKEEPKDREAGQFASSLRGLCDQLGRTGGQQARQALNLASRLSRTARSRPARGPRARRSAITVAKPQQPAYASKPLRLAAPRRSPRGSRARRLRVARPRVPRGRYVRPASVTLPQPRRSSIQQMAAIFLSRSHQRARQLVGRGLVDTAKAELATVIELFPGTEQAQTAARYAIRIFRRERGAGQPAEALVDYLAWVRAVAGPKGLEYAEYSALKSFSNKADPAVIAREAAAFIRRHPESAYAAAVRVQLALASEADGRPDAAIAALRPAIDAPPSEARAKALHALAWLYIFKGETAKARPLLEKVAAQTQSPPAATAAAALLKNLAERPPKKAILPPAAGAAVAAEVVGERLFETGNHLLRAGDPERAMDIYALYLRLAPKAPDFAAQRERIGRFKETGKMEQE